MGYAIGQLLGGVIAIYLIMRLVLLAFGKRKLARLSILAAGGIALGIATVVAGYGFAEGGPPVFGAAFGVYALPALLALAIEFIRTRRLVARLEA